LQLIPAIDLHEGQCVRLYQGDIAKKTVYSKNPAEMAKKWEGCGAEVMHVVDLDGAFEGKPKNIDAIEKIVKSLKIPVQLGGGIRTEENIDLLFEIGVSRLVIGTSAYNNPDFLKKAALKYPKKMLLGIDAKDMLVAVKGWVDVTEVKVCEMIKRFEDVPLGGIIYTDIKRDGTMQGPNTESLMSVSQISPFPVIASGGISSEEDIQNVINMKLANVEGIIIGKALYNGAINLKNCIDAVNA